MVHRCGPAEICHGHSVGDGPSVIVRLKYIRTFPRWWSVGDGPSVRASWNILQTVRRWWSGLTMSRTVLRSWSSWTMLRTVRRWWSIGSGTRNWSNHYGEAPFKSLTLPPPPTKSMEKWKFFPRNLLRSPQIKWGKHFLRKTHLLLKSFVYFEGIVWKRTFLCSQNWPFTEMPQFYGSKM